MKKKVLIVILIMATIAGVGGVLFYVLRPKTIKTGLAKYASEVISFDLTPHVKDGGEHGEVRTDPDEMDFMYAEFEIKKESEQDVKKWFESMNPREVEYGIGNVYKFPHDFNSMRCDGVVTIFQTVATETWRSSRGTEIFLCYDAEGKMYLYIAG